MAHEQNFSDAAVVLDIVHETLGRVDVLDAGEVVHVGAAEAVALDVAASEGDDIILADNIGSTVPVEVVEVRRVPVGRDRVTTLHDHGLWMLAEFGAGRKGDRSDERRQRGVTVDGLAAMDSGRVNDGLVRACDDSVGRGFL